MSPNNLPDQQSNQPLQQKTEPSRFGFAGQLAAKFQNNALTPLLALVALLLGLFAVLVTIGVWRGAHRGYCVTFGDKSTTSQVVILHGKPGGAWWFDPRIEEKTTLRRSDLLPAFVADLNRVRSFDSLVEAQHFVTAIESVSGRD